MERENIKKMSQEEAKHFEGETIDIGDPQNGVEEEGATSYSSDSYNNQIKIYSGVGLGSCLVGVILLILLVVLLIFFLPIGLIILCIVVFWGIVKHFFS